MSQLRSNSRFASLHQLVSVSVHALHLLTMRVACGHRFASQIVLMIAALNAPPSFLVRAPYEVADHRMFRQLTSPQPHQIALEFQKVPRQ